MIDFYAKYVSFYAKYVTITIVVAGIAFSAGKFMTPAKVNTVVQTKIVYRDRIIEDKSKNIKEHVVETKKSDGTVTIVTDIGEKDEDHKLETKNQTTSSTQTIIVQNRPTWRIGTQYNPAIPLFQTTKYTGILERQIFSEIYGGLAVGSDHSVGFILTIGF